jgi:hypothetical protein
MGNPGQNLTGCVSSRVSERRRSTQALLTLASALVTEALLPVLSRVPALPQKQRSKAQVSSVFRLVSIEI